MGGDEFCEAVVEHHPEVTSLSLRKCKAVTDEGLDKLIAGCKHLETVDLTLCTGVSDEGMKALAAVCKVVDDPPEENEAESKQQSPPKRKPLRKAVPLPIRPKMKKQFCSDSSDDHS